jgi:hypothetical protein
MAEAFYDDALAVDRAWHQAQADQAEEEAILTYAMGAGWLS